MDPPHGPVRAVLLDVMGTLVDLSPPAPRLHRALAAEGHAHPEAAVAAALRSEVAHYLRHHLRGRDRAGLAALRHECAAVLGRGLGGDHPPLARLREMLMESLRFVPYPDARPALEGLAGRGLRLAVVSNWDISLAGVLAELGLDRHLEVVVTSAEVGAAKPAAPPFRTALARCGVAPAEALHCGDDPVNDIEGARRAGIRAVLIARTGGDQAGSVPFVTSLTQLTALTEVTNLP